MRIFFKYFIVLFILALVFHFGVHSYLNASTPKVLNDIIEHSRENEKLMLSIGGFSSYKLTYNNRMTENDSLHFQIIIYGLDKGMIYSGNAVRDNDEWIIAKIDTTYYSY
jgi:hypothetical protein